MSVTAGAAPGKHSGRLQVGGMTGRFWLLSAAAMAGIIVVGILHLGVGTVWVPPGRVLDALLDRSVDPVDRQIVWHLRFPRALVGAAVGAMLGLSGAMLQVIMRNSLAEPGLTGVSAGGVLFGVAFLTGLWGLPYPGGWLPYIILSGSLTVGGLVYLASLHRGRVEPFRLVLTAVILNAFIASLTSIMMLRAQSALGGILPWLIGSLHGRVWDDVRLILPWAAVTIPTALLMARFANVIQLDDDIARGVGLRLQLARATLFTTAAALAAGAVSVSGAIAFVGLITPNVARRLTGDDARRLFPLSMLLGALLLLIADLVAQSLSIRPPIPGNTQRAGLPVGAVLALIGGPMLIVLLRRAAAVR